MADDSANGIFPLTLAIFRVQLSHLFSPRNLIRPKRAVSMNQNSLSQHSGPFSP